MIETKWYKNERELIYFQRAMEWAEKIKRGFIAQKEYKGFPMLPDCWMEIMKIYDECPHEDERRMIVSVLSSEFTEALRHWKVDRDGLYGTDWEKFSYI